MKNQIDIMEASVYVGTYSKYNNASIFGDWIHLIDYSCKEDFLDACRELHADEDDPEFMFQDYEFIPEGLINECWISNMIFEMLNFFSTIDTDLINPFLIWYENGSYILTEGSITEHFESFQDDYRGQYESQEDFAWHLIDEVYDLPDIALNYFDYKSFAYDLFLGDYWFKDGYVFYNS